MVRDTIIVFLDLNEKDNEKPPRRVRPPRMERGSLTVREWEVMRFLAEGWTVKEIACGFGLSAKTVEVHKYNLMRKLDIHNRANLVHYAIQHGIIKLAGLPPAMGEIMPLVPVGDTMAILD